MKQIKYICNHLQIVSMIREWEEPKHGGRRSSPILPISMWNSLIGLFKALHSKEYSRRMVPCI